MGTHSLRLSCVTLLSSALAVSTLSAAERTRDVATIRSLIARLHKADDSKGYALADKLAGFKKEAMPFLIEGLKSPDAATRKWCARTMTNVVGGYGDYSGRKDAATGGLPLLEALKIETDDKIKWYMVQAIGSIQPHAQRAIPMLVEAMNEGSPELKDAVFDALGEYRSKASRAKPALIELLPNNKLEQRYELGLQYGIMTALRQIGLDDDDLRAFSRLDVRDGSTAAHEIFDELIEHPKLELEFLKTNPKLLSTLPKNQLALVELFSHKDPKREALRAHILKQENLPKFIRVDRDRGESYGHVMTLPRKVQPGNCFPQRAKLIKFAGDTAEIAVFLKDEDYKVWFKENLARVYRDGKCGFIDESGKIVIKPQFQRAENFSEGMAVVWENGKAGYIRRDGSYLKKPQYNWAYWFKHGLGSVNLNGKYGLINSEGEWVLKPTISGNLDPTEDGFIAMTSDGWYHRLDKTGLVIRTSREVDWIDYSYLDKYRNEASSTPPVQRRRLFRRHRRR